MSRGRRKLPELRPKPSIPKLYHPLAHVSQYPPPSSDFLQSSSFPEPSEKSAQFPPFFSPTSAFSSVTSSNMFQGQKNQGFMDMLRSAEGYSEEEDNYEDGCSKKEVSSQKEEIEVKVDAKENNQKTHTPRSKHSATEQRRRSKINNRFQNLRQLIPNSDQKRDTASFLLEVVEYIQFLQEKVSKYEALFPGWNPNSMKFTTWKHNHGLEESIADHSQSSGRGLMFAGKLDNKSISMLGNVQNPVESENRSMGTPYGALDHHPGLTSRAASATVPSQQNVCASSVGKNGQMVQSHSGLLSDVETRSFPADSDILKEQEELMIKGGRIRLSSIYSPGLLSSLTQALESSGVDLSHANVTMQIDLGKRVLNRSSANTSAAKDHDVPSSCKRTLGHYSVPSSGEDHDVPSSCKRTLGHYSVPSSGEDSDQAKKRLRIDKR